MLRSKLVQSLSKEYDISSVDIFNSAQDAIDNILAYILGKKVLDIKLTRDIELSKKEIKKLKCILDKLCNKHIPYQYITETVYIYGMHFFVNKHVLIPRQDTECLIHEAISYINANKYETMLDMCTGSGVVGISVAKCSNIKHVDMTDISKGALKVARKNIKELNTKDKCHTFISDVFKNVDLNKKYDIITANPPYVTKSEYEDLSLYVKEEPYIALVSPDDGLYFYKKIANGAKPHLNNNGMLVFEIGFSQADKVTEILRLEGYSDIVVKKDLNSNDRVVSCRFQKK